MTQTPMQGPVVPVKPEPNIYTVLLIVTAVVLAVALGVMLHNLMGNYGLSFGEVFDPSYQVPQ